MGIKENVKNCAYDLFELWIKEFENIGCVK